MPLADGTTSTTGDHHHDLRCFAPRVSRLVELLRDTLSIWGIRPDSATRIGHPTPFPVELPQRLIELHTYRDEVVLDPCMGAGTTAVAASDADRHFVGYGIVPEYRLIARQRLAVVDPIGQ